MRSEEQRQAVGRWLAKITGASTVSFDNVRLLAGGAIQQNWAADILFSGGSHAGPLAAVIRCDSESQVAVSWSRPHEFALLRAAFAAGTRVPEPLWLCEDISVLGRQFFVMRRVEGLAAGFKLARDDRLVPDRPALARSLGRQLAHIHSIRPPRSDLSFLPPLQGAAAAARIRHFREYLDTDPLPRPVLEYGLRLLELAAPPPGEIVLCHNDFRTGNYMVHEGEVTAILDWEFAGWGDRLEDIGWFCAKCWRFGAVEREAGGIGPREDFYAGYESGSGVPIDRARVPYWELMATMRWAIIALQQAERHTSGRERNLELALTGHIVPELELDILAAVEQQLKEAA